MLTEILENIKDTCTTKGQKRIALAPTIKEKFDESDEIADNFQPEIMLPGRVTGAVSRGTWGVRGVPQVNFVENAKLSCKAAL